ncbi:MAG: hypothetical protein IJ597_05770, partial [Synergistaceae bacterium]|nr:hypothetical protein [Synergistaceae bacterium]
MNLTFIDLYFVPFALLTLLLYYVLPRRAQWLVMLFMSLAFYTTYGIEHFPFIISASLIAYFAAILMDRQQKKA